MIDRAHRDRALPFLWPAAVVLGGVLVLPALYVFWLALTHHTLFAAPSFAGVDHFLRMSEDPRFWNALGNTVYFTVVSVAAEIILGLGIALLLAGQRQGRGIAFAAILAPWAIPTVVSAKLWEWLYNTDFGALNALLGTSINWLGSPLWAIHAAIAMDVWKATPFVALLLFAGLQRVPRELYQAALLDGAGPWIQFWRITLPLIWPLILIVVIFRSIDAFRVFDAIYVLTGGGPANTTETLSIYAYRILFQTLDFGYGSALAVAVFACVGILTGFYAFMARRAQ